ncbi:MAG: YeeE/YedE family protein [Gammaproteobacteria bacterium]|nr:YeeE/YedE family protein [Gammaproteobacteria bacterium]MCW8987003.1 YeeE/YedE family protein [Gammaproteobacteria bacterium]
MGELNLWLVGGGLTVGAIFGVLVQYHRLCLVAATGNLLLIKDNRQVLAFMAALIVAITGTQLLEFTETVAIADSAYRNSQLDWFGASLGGLIFGIGGVMAGGCATRTLVRSAEGSLHAVIALLFFMLFAASAQFGFLEKIRLGITQSTAINLTGDASIATILGLPQWIPAVVIVIIMAAYMIKNWNPAAKWMVIAGAAIGALVVSGWYITGVLAQDDFNPTKPSAITVSGPLARFGYILISSKIPALSFAISFVIGITVAVLLFTLATGRFKLEPPKKEAFKFAILGGSLMGIGGIMAYGCNVGQGLSGISTLSFESMLAFAGMFAGTALSVKWMEKNS